MTFFSLGLALSLPFSGFPFFSLAWVRARMCGGKKVKGKIHFHFSSLPPSPQPTRAHGLTLDFFLASLALGALASCFCLFLA